MPLLLRPAESAVNLHRLVFVMQPGRSGRYDDRDVG